MNDRGLEHLAQVLFEIGKAIGSDHDPSLLLARISELTCSLVAADTCAVLLLDMSSARLSVYAAHGLDPERLHALSFRVGEGVAGWVMERGEPALIADVAGDLRFVHSPGERQALGAIESLVCVPLLARGHRIGVMTATARRKAAFSQSQLELLGFIAKTIALDIENIRLHRVSVTDPLTGVFNREFLHRRLPAELAAAAERGMSLSVAMIDIDHFKPINDRFGHEAGDRVLADVAHRLRSAIRSDDMLVRYGGEEFLVVLPGASRQRALEVGERMRLRIEGHPVLAQGRAIRVCISVGIAEHRATSAGCESADSLIRRADVALYAAKGRGRNRVEVSP